MIYLDVAPDPIRGGGEAGMLLVLVAVVVALVFIAAILAVGIFLFVRRRNQRVAGVAEAQHRFAEPPF
jgi:hypothetical protein